MKTNRLKYCVFFFTLLIVLQCRKPYVPAVFIKGDNYLVVDGFVNTSQNGITTIILTRTKNLTDTVISISEPGAAVSIQDNNGALYPLFEQANDGIYKSNALQLNSKGQYKIVIKTANSKRYESDFVSAKTTPPIDSISWRQDSTGVHVFANTHDPLNNTKFYRWQYVLTWQYNAQLESAWALNGNTIYPIDPLTQSTYICYHTTFSTSILLANSAALSQDVISMAPLFTIPPNDSTLKWRMSIQALQYALTPQAYFYWQVIQKNSQQLGTLFDLQPSQLEGNIHSLDNPTEPVVGFLSAGTMEDKRISITKYDIVDWVVPAGSYNCLTKLIGQDPNDFSNWTYPDNTYTPWYFVSGGGLFIAKKECIDCRLSGGTTIKPSFW